MSKAADSRLVILGLVGLMSAMAETAAARRQVQGGDLVVSSATAAAAESGDPVAFAAALAKERVPAGFVVSAQEQPSGAPAPTPGERSLNGALQTFLARRADYRAEQSTWALVVKPRKETVCDAALKRSLAPATFAVPAYEAFWRIAIASNPSGAPSAPPGVVCGGGNCDQSRRPSHLTTVSLSLSGTTLEDGLSQTVYGAPGLVWLLREQWSDQRKEWTCGLEYFSDEYHVATSYVLARVAGKP